MKSLGWLLALAGSGILGHAEEPASSEPSAVDQAREKVESARASISQNEHQQREALSHLFVINQRIKDIARKRTQLSDRMLAHEADVRTVAQDVKTLEQKAEAQHALLNARLRQLYRERDQKTLRLLFSARTPTELERAHRDLRSMVDADHKQLKHYLTSLRDLRQRRAHLKSMVGELTRLHAQVQGQENQLTQQMQLKSRVLTSLAAEKSNKLDELKGLREAGALDALAFFERKGQMRAPVEGPLVREYGSFVDPNDRFRLMHKGLFYRAKSGSSVRAIASGRVAAALTLPGYGPTLVVDHGDSYYSIYGFCSQLKTKEGASVKDGDTVCLSGQGSPLFGPGLYFEIRHFTDAIDPRPWIKEPGLRTALTD